jgi:hypothetical protein
LRSLFTRLFVGRASAFLRLFLFFDIVDRCDLVRLLDARARVKARFIYETFYQKNFTFTVERQQKTHKPQYMAQRTIMEHT